MSPVTPSPFRFITKPPKNLSKDTATSPPTQFAPTPRFHIPPTQHETPHPTPVSTLSRLRYNVASASPSTSSRSSFRSPAVHPRETIEEAEGPSFPTSPLYKKRRIATPSRGEDIEATSSPPSSSWKPKPWTRTYGSDSDSDHASSSSPAPATAQRGVKRKRFLFTPAPSTAPATPTLSAHLRPIRTPAERERVPVDWSPRKSRVLGRWAVGGLAAEVAGWMVEAQSMRGGGGVVNVVEVRAAEGMFVVRGADDGGRSVRVLLSALPSRGNGLTREVVPGARIAYGLPSWEVMLQGEIYKFLVTWRVDEASGYGSL